MTRETPPKLKDNPICSCGHFTVKQKEDEYTKDYVCRKCKRYIKIRKNIPKVRVFKKFGEEVGIRRLKEKVTPRDSMVKYLRGEKIVRQKYQTKYKTKQEVKAYNDGIKTAINMIASCRTFLEDFIP